MDRKTAIFAIIFGSVLLVGLVAYDYLRFFDGKLHVVFCNVGQGDAVFIRTPSGKNILYDGGPDKEVLSCLGHYMPFWERSLHLLMVSHPHDDHFSGMHYVIERYIALYFVTENLANSTKSYEGLVKALEGKKIPIRYVYAGDEISLKDGVEVSVLGPTKEYLGKTSPKGLIGETGEFASLIVKVTYGNFDVLLTGDSQVSGLLQVKSLQSDLEILQTPHHGSKTGLDTNTIRLLAPKHAVISVGKNRYGHPSKEIIRLFHEHEISVSRTDREGNIEFVSDGKKWWKNTDHK